MEMEQQQIMEPKKQPKYIWEDEDDDEGLEECQDDQNKKINQQEQKVNQINICERVAKIQSQITKIIVYGKKSQLDSLIDKFRPIFSILFEQSQQSKQSKLDVDLCIKLFKNSTNYLLSYFQNSQVKKQEVVQKKEEKIIEQDAAPGSQIQNKKDNEQKKSKQLEKQKQSFQIFLLIIEKQKNLLIKKKIQEVQAQQDIMKKITKLMLYSDLKQVPEIKKMSAQLDNILQQFKVNISQEDINSLFEEFFKTFEKNNDGYFDYYLQIKQVFKAFKEKYNPEKFLENQNLRNFLSTMFIQQKVKGFFNQNCQRINKLLDGFQKFEENLQLSQKGKKFKEILEQKKKLQILDQLAKVIIDPQMLRKYFPNNMTKNFGLKVWFRCYKCSQVQWRYTLFQELTFKCYNCLNIFQPLDLGRATIFALKLMKQRIPQDMALQEVKYLYDICLIQKKETYDTIVHFIKYYLNKPLPYAINLSANN